VIVLDKTAVEASSFGKSSLAEALREEAPIIHMPFGLDNEDLIQCRSMDLHLNTPAGFVIPE
jgi:hypothetical protein